jgi:hypothetical protein
MAYVVRPRIPVSSTPSCAPRTDAEAGKQISDLGASGLSGHQRVIANTNLFGRLDYPFHFTATLNQNQVMENLRHFLSDPDSIKSLARYWYRIVRTSPAHGSSVFPNCHSPLVVPPVYGSSVYMSGLGGAVVHHLAGSYPYPHWQLSHPPVLE